MNKKGFTLVELLVVIGIMLILMALMYPALNSINEKANRTQCQNNLKQITAAAISQFADLKNDLPYRTSWDQHGSAADKLLPYLKNITDIFHCPSSEGHNSENMLIPSISPPFYVDYEFNGFLSRFGTGTTSTRRQNGITDASAAAYVYDHPYTGSASNPSRAHEGGANVGYLDGHVVFLKSENMGTVETSGDDGSEFYLLGHIYR
ncbi:MAG: DUF1559 domain-containing protein [Lentisphaerota bacterium]